MPALAPLAVLAMALYGIELPLFSLGPGPVREVVPRLQVTGAPTYRPQGKILLTTVNVWRLNTFDALYAAFSRDAEIVPEDVILVRGQTVRQYRRESLSQMDASKVAAAVYALGRTTGYPEEHGDGALVQYVAPGSPAEGRLFPGELIVEVNGERVTDLEQISEAVGRSGGGALLRLTVEAEGKREEVTVRPEPVGPDGRLVVGVVLVPGLPIDLNIESDDDGGPSAGLMWALGLTDLLTPGSLTSGRTVAGTGAIDLRGRVLPIGSVEHKVRAARRAGAEVFFLPRENLDEARRAGEDIELVPVGTIEAAVRYLERGTA